MPCIALADFHIMERRIFMDCEYNDYQKRRITPQDEKKLAQIKQRVELRLRVVQGLKELFRLQNLWKLIFPILLCVATFIAWREATVLISDQIGNVTALLVTPIQYLLKIIFSLVTLLLLLGVLKIIGTPLKTKAVKVALLGMKSDFTDSFHCPLLLSYRENKATEEIRMVFYSRWTTINHWLKHQKEIADALGIRLDENGIRKHKGKYRILVIGVPDNIVDYNVPKSKHF